MRTTFKILGVIFLVMTVIGAFLLKNPPAGYKPAGWTPAPPTAKAAATTQEFTPGETLRTPGLLFHVDCLCAGTSAGLMVISQLVPFAKSVGIPSAVLASLGTGGGRSRQRFRTNSVWLDVGCAGPASTCLRLMIGISMVSMPLLVCRGRQCNRLYVMVFIVYWCYGTQFSVNASATADFFGDEECRHELRNAVYRVGRGRSYRCRGSAASCSTSTRTTRWRSTRLQFWPWWR